MNSRVQWAATYLAQARCVSRPQRGAISITAARHRASRDEPKANRLRTPSAVPRIRGVHGRVERAARRSQPHGGARRRLDAAPDELIDQGYKALRAEVESTLLERLQASSPEFFEQAVVDLLVAMGYGGTHENAARRIGKTGDEGIDGVIDEDRLGLDAIYIQAKRWKTDHLVGSPDVQGFVGSLVGKKAAKGVFITTSDFSQPAVKYLDSVAHRVVPLNGADVARMMFDHGIGVRPKHTYEVKAVDDSYFEDEG